MQLASRCDMLIVRPAAHLKPDFLLEGLFPTQESGAAVDTFLWIVTITEAIEDTLIPQYNQIYYKMSKSIKNIENLDSMNQNDLMKLLRVKEMENERMKKSVANLMTEGESWGLLLQGMIVGRSGLGGEGGYKTLRVCMMKGVN